MSLTSGNYTYCCCNNFFLHFRKDCSDTSVLKHKNIDINMLSVFMEDLDNNLFLTCQR